MKWLSARASQSHYRREVSLLCFTGEALVIVLFLNLCATIEDPADDRKPSFLIPSGPSSSEIVLRGQVLEMECIAEGL